MTSNYIKYFPIKVLIFFNILTILVFVLFPISWGLDNYEFLLLFVLLFISLFMLNQGYLYGLSSKQLFSRRNWSFKSITRWFYFSLVIKIFWLLPTYTSTLNLSTFDFNGVINYMLIGLSDFGEGYDLRQQALNESILTSKTSFLFFLINRFFVAIQYTCVPLGFQLWDRLNKPVRFAVILLLIFDMIFWISTGTNIGVFHGFIILSTSLAIVILKKNTTKSSKRIIHRFFLISSVLIVILFSSFMTSRVSSYFDPYSTNHAGSYVNKDHVLYKIVPKQFHNTITLIGSYLGQGYFHTGLAFKYEFESTSGFGNNFTTLGLSPRFSSEDLMKKTYVYKLQNDGAGIYQNWHSAYTWYANDVSFFLVPFVFYLWGYFLSAMWMSAFKLSDPFSPSLLILTVLEITFFYANNQTLSFNFFTFWILLFFYFITNFRYAK